MASPPLFVDNHRPVIQLYGPDPTTALWDDPASLWGDPRTQWDDAATAYAWRDVQCQVTAFVSTWGADAGDGVLAQSAAGTLTLNTYDPDRLLDPKNPDSPLAKSRAIGSPVRLVQPPVLTSTVIGYGYVDELTYDYASHTGQLTAADEIATTAGCFSFRSIVIA